MNTKKKSSTSRKGRAMAETTSGPLPEQLTYGEVKSLCNLIGEEFISFQNTPALNALMILANEIAGHCKDSLHVEGICMALQYALFMVSGDADAPMLGAVQSYREQMKRGELRRTASK
jgi:hypothetical protein